MDEKFKQLQGLMFLLGVEYRISDSEDGTCGSVYTRDLNWREVAETLSSIGLHISVFENKDGHALRVFFYDYEDPDKNASLSKYPPYTFKA